MWSGFERRVKHDGSINVPTALAGKVVVILVDESRGGICGSPDLPHIASGLGPFCHVCEAEAPAGVVFGPGGRWINTRPTDAPQGES